jgi:hypothetical protein
MDVEQRVAYVVPDQQALILAADAALESARAIEIDGPQMYEVAGQELVAINSQIKTLDEKRKEITRPLDQAKQAVMDLFKPAIDRRTEACGIIRAAMAKWYAAEEQRKREAQARLDAEARAERERKAKEAADLAAAGKPEEAAAAQVESEIVCAPTVVTTVPKVAGVAMKETWECEIVDKVARLAYLVEHPDEIDAFIEFKLAPHHSLARTYHDKLALPGLKAVKHLSPSASRRAA